MNLKFLLEITFRHGTEGTALVKLGDVQNMIIKAKHNPNREASISLYKLEGNAVHHHQTK